MEEYKKDIVEFIKDKMSVRAVCILIAYIVISLMLLHVYNGITDNEALSEATLENITIISLISFCSFSVIIFIVVICLILKDRRKSTNEPSMDKEECKISTESDKEKLHGMDISSENREEDTAEISNRIEAFIIEQDDPERDKKFIEINKNVKREYWVLGVSLSALSQKENKLKQWANTDIDLRLCMLDADMAISELCKESIEHGYCSIKNYMESSEIADITPEKIIEMIQNAEIKCKQDCKDFLALYHVLINSVHFKEYYHTSRDYKKTIQKSYMDLKNIADDIGKDRHGKYKLQLRFADSFIPLSMTVKDASLDTGSMVVEFQLPFTNKKILIMLEKAEKEEMFNEFVDLYKEVWERANQANE